MQDNLTEQLVTKQDLKHGLKELDVKMETIKSEIKHEIKNIVMDIKASQGIQSLQIIGVMTGIITVLLAMFRFLPEILKQTL